MDSCNDRYVDRANELYPGAVINAVQIRVNITVQRWITYPNAVINVVQITANVIVWCKNTCTCRTINLNAVINVVQITTCV